MAKLEAKRPQIKSAQNKSLGIMLLSTTFITKSMSGKAQFGTASTAQNSGWGGGGGGFEVLVSP